MQEKQQCSVCNDPHNICKCEHFLSADYDEKLILVRAARLYFNCLRPNHSAKFCRFKPCSKCKRYHNDLLHRNEAQAIANSDENHKDNIASQRSLQAVVASHVLLSTALVKIIKI